MNKMLMRYNRILILGFFISIIITNISYSQLKNIGIKGGLNLSEAELDYTELNYKIESKTGFNVYLFYDIVNFRNVIISVEAGYSQKGYNIPVIVTNEFGVQEGEFTIYNRLNYIDINALAQFILRSSSVSPYISVGPVISFYTGYNISNSGNRNDSEYISLADPLFGNLKSPVLGFIAGAGIEINKIIPQTIITEVRYNFDLTNSYNGEYLNYQRNYLWQFNLGIKL